MNGLALTVAFSCLAIAVAGAVARRWFPRAGVAIVLLGFAGTSVAFLALLAVGAVDGNVPQLGRGNGVIRRVDRPGDFWCLVTLYVAAGAGLLAGSLWGLRKHLKGELWPTGRD